MGMQVLYHNVLPVVDNHQRKQGVVRVEDVIKRHELVVCLHHNSIRPRPPRLLLDLYRKPIRRYVIGHVGRPTGFKRCLVSCAILGGRASR
jgi:hypothetical protein